MYSYEPNLPACLYLTHSPSPPPYLTFQITNPLCNSPGTLTQVATITEFRPPLLFCLSPYLLAFNTASTPPRLRLKSKSGLAIGRRTAKDMTLAQLNTYLLNTHSRRNPERDLHLRTSGLAKVSPTDRPTDRSTIS